MRTRAASIYQSVRPDSSIGLLDPQRPPGWRRQVGPGCRCPTAGRAGAGLLGRRAAAEVGARELHFAVGLRGDRLQRWRWCAAGCLRVSARKGLWRKRLTTIPFHSWWQRSTMHPVCWNATSRMRPRGWDALPRAVAASVVPLASLWYNPRWEGEDILLECLEQI